MPSRPIRIVTQGPSEPVRVVTQGIADPVRIISGTPSDPVRVVTSGISTPVKIVDGSLDPIGDTLRADAVAYWKMDEASGIRVDSSPHGLNLSLDWVDDVTAATGKIGQAAQFIDNTVSASALQSLTLGGADFSSGIGLACWVKFNQFIPADDGQFYIALVNNSITASIALQVRVGILAVNIPDIGIYTPASSGLSINTWHLVICWKDVVNAGSYLQIDDDPVISGAYAIYDNPDQITLVGQPSFANNVDTSLIDEMLLINRAFTQDERDYLWNSGAGRTLFP